MFLFVEMRLKGERLDGNVKDNLMIGWGVEWNFIKCMGFVW